ncbi:MAG TPA: sigma 54-interacting transcriptional regulator [Thermoclostridium caenicola]|uniref:sigma-54-dependent Fis family transcriptional regulator n=1 Tax=Thermoclostridium caenicola TaxID=659425 RepID=UPI002B8553DB|nr:sigma 54-interacting transcriptional regulator [Thermoclostridium caenicola]HPO76123.1 sigma 54-interacting transcriptional regulator [Thermoclostridium caenicola]
MNHEDTNFVQYYDMSQKVAEAIKAVLGIDVTIMNSAMDRISGTGIYKELIGEKIEKASAFYYCLCSGKPYVITNQSSESDICKDCPRYLTCMEKAMICVPIVHGEQVVGVIGVIAFNEDQKDKIVENYNIYLNFLEKMADLLGAKYSEHKINMEKRLMSDRLISALNLMNAGVLLYDDQGNVLYKNKALKVLLNNIGVYDDDGFAREIWNKALLMQNLPDNDNAEPCEIMVEYDKEKYSLLSTITHIKTSDSTGEIILTLQDVSKFKRQLAQSIAKNRVKFGFDNILGVSQSLIEAKNLAEKAAMTDSNVLIYGESGTGKELFARAIHDRSKRAEHPLVTINCGAIPDGLLESELFGHEKGAFTGAYANKIGKFEVADNGTVFLDEISEMPFCLQVKLLRIIQEREICRVGSNKVHKVNVRIIAATNTDLMQRIKEGLFRDDLYYRLNVIPIQIPPLRERKEDIIYLANYFTEHYASIFGRNIAGISDEVIDVFMKYPWPGNVRELQSIIECAVNFETSNTISMRFIEKRLKPVQGKFGEISKYMTDSLDGTIRNFEKEIIENTINKYSYMDSKEHIIQKVCTDLNISRATLYRKINSLNINLNCEKILKSEI